MHGDGAAHALDSTVHVATLGERKPRPEQQLVAGRRERRGFPVALGGLGMATLAHQVVPFGGNRVGVGEIEQPPQLAERVPVVLNPQLHGSPPCLALRRDHDQQGSRLVSPDKQYVILNQ